MDAPRIQYAKTSDGVSIAYWTLGEGMPFVQMPGIPWSHAQLEWQYLEFRRWYERLAENRMLIRYDGRGLGLSDRNRSDYSLPSLELDLEAVVDGLGLERFTLLGIVNTGPVAIAYAARNPTRVQRLLLWNAYASISDIDSENQAVLRLYDNWEVFTETMACLRLGWSAGEPARRYAALMRESVTAKEFLAMLTAMARSFDVADLLQAVRSPTLVLHRRQVGWPDVAVARGLASRIPGATLALLEGAESVPYLGDVDAVLSAIDGFLDIRPPEPHLPSGMTAILFADIADSTALTERLGDIAFRDKARDLDASLRTIIREHDGTPIEGKLLGDGALAVFTSARQAIEAALACGRSGADAGLPLHLGIHAGDVIREENNVYGGAVNIASRISGLSAPGEVLVSETVRSLARTSAGVSFEDRGEQALKGVGEAVRVWSVSRGA